MSLNLIETSLTGVYQDQEEGITIGEEAITLNNFQGAPIFAIGFYRGTQSIDINVFFDPQNSNRIKNRSFGTIGLIQVGRLYIDNIPVTINFYKNDASYPRLETSILYSGWVDITSEDLDGKEVKDPMFPNWLSIETTDYTEEDLFYYPQDYGGYVKYNGTLKESGENLCAYLTGSYSLDSGNLATAMSFPDYLDSINVNNYIIYFFPNNIPTGNFFDINYLRNVFIYLNQIKMIPIIPSTLQYDSEDLMDIDEGNGNTTNFTGYYSNIEYSSSRLYIEWIAFYGSTIKKRLFLFPNPENPALLTYFNPDDDFIDSFRTAKANSAPVSSTIYNSMMAEYQTQIGYDNSAYVKLVYSFFTYACAIDLQVAQNYVIIYLFEGFKWKMSNQFTDTNGWNNVTLPETPNFDSEGLNYFKFMVTNYYKNRYGENFQVHFDE